jgi:uncharacterized membrane protein YadS
VAFAFSLSKASSTRGSGLGGILPGLALAALVATAAVLAAPLAGRIVPVPATVIALAIGIALHPLARRPWFVAGLEFWLKAILRWAVALLGLRIALGDIAALGSAVAILVVVAMVATVAAGFLLARALGSAAPTARSPAPALRCGASATLATSIMLPHYEKGADVALWWSPSMRCPPWRW